MPRPRIKKAKQHVQVEMTHKGAIDTAKYLNLGKKKTEDAQVKE